MKMKINLIPKNYLGKLSVLFIILMPIFFYVGMLSVDFYNSVLSGRTIFEDIIVRPKVALPMLAGFFLGILAFVTGVVDIVKKKDYSVFVFLSTIMGFFVLVWIFIEILFPH